MACISGNASWANAVLLFLFGDRVIRLFTADADIIAVGVSLLALHLLLQPSKMLNMAIMSGLTAIGDTRFMMYVDVPSMWIVAAGLAYVLGVQLGWGWRAFMRR